MIHTAMSMNRKQRRAQEKSAGQRKGAAQKKQDNKTRAAALRAEGLALKNEGRASEAVAPLRQALYLDQSLADVHFTLAVLARTRPELKVDIEEINRNLTDRNALLVSYAHVLQILKKNRQYGESTICQEEFCRLLPDEPYALMELGLIKSLTGGSEQATIDMARAVLMAPDNKILKSVFATSQNTAAFSAFFPEVKEAILECFKDIYDVNLYRIPHIWAVLMDRDPIYRGLLKTAMIEKTEDFDRWMDGLQGDDAAFLTDPYFTQGLRLLIIAFKHMEDILARMRRYIAINFDALSENGRIPLFEKFLFALAEQCFLNEYVFDETKEESAAIEALVERDGATLGKTAIGLIGCYRPLAGLFDAHDARLHDLAAGDPAFAAMVKTLFDDPRLEQEIKQEIPIFGEFANEISKAVKSQYEENPYPRWTTVCCLPMPNDDLPEERLRDAPCNILVAGCGTGRQALSAAARHPNGRVLAIDLSRASIAYGWRKARESGLDKRIEFVNADILSLADWDDQFDIVECSGVLHHMEDPFAGWKTLNDLLKPGGHFRIGLYSEAARQQIVKAREFIASRGFESTAAGIRACRQAIFALPTTDPMRQYLLASSDFFATSLVRDLIFHVQEHRMTLPQIKDMMDRLGLTCTKFSISHHDTVIQYDKMYPEDTERSNIDNWIAFEEKFPLTFRSMYQFWCRKNP